MLVLFAVGVMSLFWMALIAALIFAEKILRIGARLAPVFSVALIAFGLWIAVAPASVPGLASSGQRTAMPGMKM
jgi:predicted metal-binding membrane protein